MAEISRLLGAGCDALIALFEAFWLGGFICWQIYLVLGGFGYSSVSYGGRRGGFKMSAARIGTSRHNATRIPICAGEDADFSDFAEALGCEDEAFCAR